MTNTSETLRCGVDGCREAGWPRTEHHDVEYLVDGTRRRAEGSGDVGRRGPREGTSAGEDDDRQWAAHPRLVEQCSPFR